MTLLVLAFSLLFSQPQCADTSATFHEVRQNDFLSTISSNYSSSSSWELIYIYNAHQLTNPNRIYPGQILYIPHSIRCNTPTTFTEVYISLESINEQYIQEFTLDDIRDEIKQKRYNHLIESYRSFKRRQPVKQRDTEPTLSGMIYDNTVTKAGYDFYRSFYQKWEGPENAEYYYIDIKETPGPGLGTIVTVNLNDKTVYSARIKPNYEEIQSKSDEAIRYTQHYITNFDYSVKVY